MGVTAYSVIISVLFYNLSLIVVFLLSRSGLIRAKYTSALLLLLTFLGAVRLLIPIDLDQAYVIRSYKVLPAIEDTLSELLFGTVSLGGLLLLIWAAGTAVFISRDIVKLWHDRLAAMDFKKAENERASRIAKEFGKGFTLKISPDVDLPYVAGILKPVIYLPDADLTDAQWRNIFQHETQHVKAHDEWKKLFFRVIRALFWWNPLVHMSEADINLLIELQCDERVAGQGSLDEQECYLRTMIELMKRYVYGGAPVGASRMIGREKEMKIRFEALLAPKTKRGNVMRSVVLVVMLVAFLASYLVIVQPAYRPPDIELTVFEDQYSAHDITEDLKNTNTKYIIYEENEYHLYIEGEYIGILEETQISQPPFDRIPIIGG